MNVDFYTLKQALEIIESNKPFAVQYVTFDERRKESCGELRTIDECLLLIRANEQNNAGRGKTRLEKLTNDIDLEHTEGGRKNSRKVDKSRYFVRDVQPLTDGIAFGHPIRIHPKLILFINNIKVIP